MKVFRFARTKKQEPQAVKVEPPAKIQTAPPEEQERPDDPFYLPAPPCPKGAPFSDAHPRVFKIPANAPTARIIAVNLCNRQGDGDEALTCFNFYDESRDNYREKTKAGYGRCHRMNSQGKMEWKEIPADATVDRCVYLMDKK